MNIKSSSFVFHPSDNEWVDRQTLLSVPLPERCPLCGAVGFPNLSFLAHHPDDPRFLEALYYCVGCKDFFPATYCRQDRDKWVLLKVHGAPHKEAFSDALHSLSPSFIEVFDEAEIGERSKLFKIAGPGYRKALEYLVKDFAIHLHPDDSEAINNLSLAKVINNYIDHPKIKMLAKGSAWLGNDQTHTVTKHDDYSIQDLKSFVVAAAKYIDLELTVEEAADLLEAPR